MDPGHKASKNPSDNADLGFQAVGPALHIMQLNVEGLSAAKCHIISPDIWIVLSFYCGISYHWISLLV